MDSYRTARGFTVIAHKKFPNEKEDYSMTRLIQESSLMLNDDDPDEVPGSGFLWIGRDHHLNREEIKELISRMQHWVDNGFLEQE